MRDGTTAMVGVAGKSNRGWIDYSVLIGYLVVIYGVYAVEWVGR